MGEGNTSLQKSNPQKCLNKSLSINKSNNIKSNKGCVGRGSKRIPFPMQPFSDRPIENLLSSTQGYHGSCQRLSWKEDQE